MRDALSNLNCRAGYAHLEGLRCVKVQAQVQIETMWNLGRGSEILGCPRYGTWLAWLGCGSAGLLQISRSRVFVLSFASV